MEWDDACDCLFFTFVKQKLNEDSTSRWEINQFLCFFVFPKYSIASHKSRGKRDEPIIAKFYNAEEAWEMVASKASFKLHNEKLFLPYHSLTCDSSCLVSRFCNWVNFDFVETFLIHFVIFFRVLCEFMDVFCFFVLTAQKREKNFWNHKWWKIDNFLFRFSCVLYGLFNGNFVLFCYSK